MDEEEEEASLPAAEPAAALGWTPMGQSTWLSLPAAAAQPHWRGADGWTGQSGSHAGPSGTSSASTTSTMPAPAATRISLPPTSYPTGSGLTSIFSSMGRGATTLGVPTGTPTQAGRSVEAEAAAAASYSSHAWASSGAAGSQVGACANKEAVSQLQQSVLGVLSSGGHLQGVQEGGAYGQVPSMRWLMEPGSAGLLSATWPEECDAWLAGWLPGALGVGIASGAVLGALAQLPWPCMGAGDLVEGMVAVLSEHHPPADVLGLVRDPEGGKALAVAAVRLAHVVMNRNRAAAATADGAGGHASMHME